MCIPVCWHALRAVPGNGDDVMGLLVCEMSLTVSTTSHCNYRINQSQSTGYRVSQYIYRVYTGCYNTCTGCIQGVTIHVQGVYRVLQYMYRVYTGCYNTCTGCIQGVTIHVQGVYRVSQYMYRVYTGCYNTCTGSVCGSPRLTVIKLTLEVIHRRQRLGLVWSRCYSARTSNKHVLERVLGWRLQLGLTPLLTLLTLCTIYFVACSLLFSNNENAIETDQEYRNTSWGYIVVAQLTNI